jgi:single-strand DNA-binding protein
MAGSFNRVVLVGNLGRDPEVKNTPSGRTVATFSIATHENWTDEKKQKQSRTDWHLVEVWGTSAKLVGQYLSKGRLVLVDGSLRTDKFEKDGQTHWRTKVVARNVQFLDRPEKSDESVSGEEAPADAGSSPDEIPF